MHTLQHCSFAGGCTFAAILKHSRRNKAQQQAPVSAGSVTAVSSSNSEEISNTTDTVAQAVAQAFSQVASICAVGCNGVHGGGHRVHGGGNGVQGGGIGVHGGGHWGAWWGQWGAAGCMGCYRVHRVQAVWLYLSKCLLHCFSTRGFFW